MPTTPPPTWPIETATHYVVSYYPDNAAATEPTATDTTIKDYNTAIERAKQYITDNLNVGVCVVLPVTATYVYPSVAWVDF